MYCKLMKILFGTILKITKTQSKSNGNKLAQCTLRLRQLHKFIALMFKALASLLRIYLSIFRRFLSLAKIYMLKPEIYNPSIH